MNFKKHIVKQGKYTKVYFTDEMNRKQGTLECYLSGTDELLREKNLYYTQKYINGILEGNKVFTGLTESSIDANLDSKEKIQ